MRRFSLGTCWPTSFKATAQALPPSLPAPPNPLPDLRSKKQSKTSNLYANSNSLDAPEQADSGHDSPVTPTKFNALPENEATGVVPHRLETSNYSPSLVSPSATAESVTHSEFDGLCDANVNGTSDDLSLFRPTTLYASQDSLLSALAENQPTTACKTVQGRSTYGCPETEQGDMQLSETECEKLQQYSACLTTFSNGTEWELFASAETEKKPIDKMSNPQTGPIAAAIGSPQNSRSGCDQPRAGMVAEVASAWELYFNPSKRRASYRRSVKPRSHPTQSQQAKAYNGSRTSLSQSFSFGALTSAHDREGEAMQRSFTDSLMERRENTSDSGTTVLDDLSDASCDNNTYYILRRGNNAETEPRSQFTSSNAMAQMSDCSSSTVTVSDSKATMEDERLDSANRTISSDSGSSCNTNSHQSALFGALEMQTSQPPYRLRSVSTPAASRPLCITVQRHRISASRSPTCSSTSSGEVSSWLADQGPPRRQHYQPIRRKRFEPATTYTHANDTPQRYTQTGSLTADQSIVKPCIPKCAVGEMVEVGRFRRAQPGLRRRVTIHNAPGPSFQTTSIEQRLQQRTESSTLNYSKPTDYNAVPKPPFGDSAVIVPGPSFCDQCASPALRHVNLRSNLVQSKTTIKLEPILKDGPKKSSHVSRRRGIYNCIPTREFGAEKQSIFLPALESPTEMSTSLSSAAERYERHVKAVVAQRQYFNEYTFKCQQESHSDNSSPLQKDPLQHRSSFLSETCTPLEVTKESTSNANGHTEEESIDPGLWQDKLDQIARWQCEVNNAIHSGKAEMDECFPPPESNASSIMCTATSTPEKDDTLTDRGFSQGEVHTATGKPAPFPESPLDTQTLSCSHDRSPEYDNEVPAIPAVLFASYQSNQASESRNFVGKNNPATDGHLQREHRKVKLAGLEDQLEGPFYPPFTGTFPVRCTGPGSPVKPLSSSMYEDVRVRQHGVSCHYGAQTSRFQAPASQMVPQSMQGAMQRLGSPPQNDWQQIGRLVSPWDELSKSTYPSISPVQSANQAKITSAGDPHEMNRHAVCCSPVPLPNLSRSTPVAANQTHHMPCLKDSSIEGAAALTAKGSDSRPHIYEGEEYWQALDGTDNTQWTRIPIRLNQTTDNLTHVPILSPTTPSLYKQMDGSRHRTVTRLQLTGSRPPLPFSVSNNHWNQCIPNPGNNFQSPIIVKAKANTTARRASTMSPVRRQPDIAPAESLHNSQMTQTSGFVSNGSINMAVEGAGGGVVRSNPTAVPTEERNCVLNKPLSLSHSQGYAGNFQAQPNNFHDPKVTSMFGQKYERLCPSDMEKPSRINIRIPPQHKLLLGRVASNDDICIETEIPFAFSIAATENEICITKEDATSKVRQPPSTVDQGKTVRRIPVSLRLTFGSETNLAVKDEQELNLPQELYRSICHIDLPDAQVAQQSHVTPRRNPGKRNNPLRYSLPCIPYRGEEIGLTEYVS